MRILQAPDIHCFYENYGKVLSGGTNSRFVDWQDTADALVTTAIDNEVDAVVFPGDLFKNSKPAPAQIIVVSNLFARLERAGIKVVGCAGNHDLVAHGQQGPCELVSIIAGKDTAITIPKVVQLDEMDIAVLPSVKPAGLSEETSDPVEFAGMISTKLVEIARSLLTQCSEGKKKVLIGHWTISGSVTSSGQVLCGGVEPTIPLSELIGMGWDAVLFGHIHKPQVLNEKPFIGYAGALERVDFGEEDDKRGCFIVDLDDDSHKWIDLPARRFCTIHLSEHTISNIIDTGSYDIDWKGTEDAIVRIKYNTTSDRLKMINNNELMKSAYENGKAYFVASVIPDIVQIERSRDISITENTKPIEALQKWLGNNSDISEDMKLKAIAMGQKLLGEVIG